MGSKGPGHPPLLHPPPSIWVQEQQKLRLVQIAEALYSVLSGGWHGDSRGADDKEGWSTSAMKPLRTPPQPATAAVRGSKAGSAAAPTPGSCGPVGWGGQDMPPCIPQTVHEQVLGQRAGLLVHPSARTTLNHCVPWACS